MEYLSEKIHFLQHEFAPILQGIDPDTQALFGKMKPQQMVEHMAEYIRMAYGHPKIEKIAYPEAVVEKMRLFLESEKGFRPNTGNPLMSETPNAPIFPDFETAIQDLEKAINEFFIAFKTDPELEVLNPFFGVLNQKLSVQLLYKHAQHHLRQFAAIA